MKPRKTQVTRFGNRVGTARLESYGARKQEHGMHKFHSIAALCGDGLRPELQALFERMAIDPHTELFVRPDGMVQSGPDPKSDDKPEVHPKPKRAA